MPVGSNITNFPLKVIFLAHFVLTALSLMSYWSPTGYLFYNLLLMTLLIWCLHNKESEDPIQLTFSVNVVSIVLDIFVLAFCFPDSHSAGARFSAAMAILHLIIRPFTSIYMLQVLRERTGNPDLGGNFFPASRRQENYEDIDRPQEPQPPQQSRGGYDFSTAQQI